MKTLLYATNNTVKFETATRLCRRFGVRLERATLEVAEIQAHDGEVVARDKALRTFQALQKPVIVSDDSWLFPGLNGFPGPFMKFVNDWFTSEDWLHLLAPLADRRIILRQMVVYQDAHTQQMFSSDVEGVILPQIRGTNKYTHTPLVSFDGGKTSMAEVIAQTGSALEQSAQRTSWHELCDWLTKK